MLGTGKSFDARRRLGEIFYSKISSNKWWDKYTGQDNVLIEDMDKSHSYQAYYLKIWADKYAFPVEIKNGADLIRPKVIIVTSNYSIRECFPAKEDYEPLERRFKVIHKKDPWNKNPFNMLDAETTVLANGKTKLKLPDYRIPTPDIVGADAWEVSAKKSFKTKQLNKRRKFDQPLKAKKPLKQVNGKIVKNTETQMVIEDALPLAVTQEIAREKEVIELLSEDECDDDGAALGYAYEDCDHCGLSIIACTCMDSEEEMEIIEDDLNYDSEFEEGECSEYDDSECSQDLLDM